ncbi:hypothetical protein [Aquimarina spinulae]|uniref:hypothetical protein n=1 Tax=Aquimarina spinulae TaxID=1192023 RepID=UPI000D5533B5|nr:hypothetical protein [Aquimarina spinulae]
MNKIPEITSKDKIRPPDILSDNLLYIGHFGFNTKTKKVKIIKRLDKKCHQLVSFKIMTNGCATHYSCNSDCLIDILGKNKVEDKLIKWLDETQITVSGDSGLLISEYNESLFFNDKNYRLKGSEIDCKGQKSKDGEFWIDVYDSYHFPGINFFIKIQEIDHDKESIKLMIKGRTEFYPIAFSGWIPLEYIDPEIWIEDFFKNLASENNPTYNNYFFSGNQIELWPGWNNYPGKYEERIKQISIYFGWEAKLIPNSPAPQDRWYFSKI